ncbi:transmembrane protein 231-like [Branchiostoma floridae]|uniref:Transmembrane protein 231 n=1 Tax=Branchiostoma floridae TaxID=7739 RepID=A0A9J7LEG3_BRAFL|nr:transmembrane protein 231-like [Branchiostoma floridae]
MAVVEVYSHPVLHRYKTSICTKATIFVFACFLLTFIPPILVAYRSQGFWQREAWYREQPDVSFKHQILLLLQTSQTGDYLVWSTYQNFNQLQQGRVRVPLVKSREEDSNRDGKSDALQMTVQVPLLDTEEVYSVDLLLFFQYKLYIFSAFTMECMAYLQHTSPLPGADLTVVGDLRLHQKYPLGHTGRDTRFNTSIIDSTSIFPSAYDLRTIFESYSDRNVSTNFQTYYPVWRTGRATGQPFVISATVRYPEETILYKPGFWQLIKWGWVQYISILLVFLFVFDRIKTFVFENQILNTIVDSPTKKFKQG